MIRRIPQCYIPSFVKIGPLVPEKIFEGFLPYMRWPSWSCDQHHVNKFSFSCTKTYKKSLVKMAQWFLRKASFNSHYANDLGPRSKNHIDFEYSITFINSNSCLHLQTFRSQVAIVSEKSTVFFTFYAPNFEEVEEAYWFGPVHLSVCPSVRLSVTLALGQEPLEIGS